MAGNIKLLIALGDAMTDWPTTFARLRELDGDEWDDGAERIEAAWLAEYRAAFVAFALSRGWSRENAESWLEDDDFGVFVHRDVDDPTKQAEADVIEIEKEQP